MERMLEGAGVYVLHVTLGIYDSISTFLETMGFKQGWRLYLAENI